MASDQTASRHCGANDLAQGILALPRGDRDHCCADHRSRRRDHCRAWIGREVQAAPIHRSGGSRAQSNGRASSGRTGASSRANSGVSGPRQKSPPTYSEPETAMPGLFGKSAPPDGCRLDWGYIAGIAQYYKIVTLIWMGFVRTAQTIGSGAQLSCPLPSRFFTNRTA